MHRNPGHRNIVPEVLAALGQGDIEGCGCQLRVIEKQLVKVSHTIKKQGILVFRLDFQILMHHWRNVRARLLRRIIAAEIDLGGSL